LFRAIVGFPDGALLFEQMETVDVQSYALFAIPTTAAGQNLAE
jgi:hypothetical protein